MMSGNLGWTKGVYYIISQVINFQSRVLFGSRDCFLCLISIYRWRKQTCSIGNRPPASRFDPCSSTLQSTSVSGMSSDAENVLQPLKTIDDLRHWAAYVLSVCKRCESAANMITITRKGTMKQETRGNQMILMAFSSNQVHNVEPHTTTHLFCVFFRLQEASWGPLLWLAWFLGWWLELSLPQHTLPRKQTLFSCVISVKK